jgi:hypothetical protein
MCNMSNVDNAIRIRDAVAHFGRKPDGYGGKAALARALGISQNAISRWAGPYLPEHHARALLRKPHRLAHLMKKRK